MRRVLATHWPFLLVLAAATLLRGLLVVAYRPALFFSGDSYTYLYVSDRLTPDAQRPILYSVFVRGALWTDELILVPILQHVMGLAVGVLLYVLLLRLRLPPWLAALATVPLLLDMLQIAVEHYVLAEALFLFLLVGALALLVWFERPGAGVVAAVGALLAAATLTRTVGLFVAVAAVAYLLVRRAGVVRVAAFAVAFSVPLVGYAAWFDSHWDRFHLQKYDGHFLYGRVAPFADCRGLSLPADERPLCPSPGHPLNPPSWFVYHPESPIRDVEAGNPQEVNEIAGRFARRIILHQPTDYARAVARDFVQYFEPTRSPGPLQGQLETIELQPGAVTFSDPATAAAAIRDYQGDPAARPVIVEPLARRLAAWQGFAYTPGPLLAACALLGFVAVAWRPRSRPSAAGEALLLASSGVILLLVPSATIIFDYRYLTPALALLGAAGALGGWSLAGRLRERRVGRELGWRPPARAAPADGRPQEDAGGSGEEETTVSA